MQSFSNAVKFYFFNSGFEKFFVKKVYFEIQFLYNTAFCRLGCPADLVP